MPIDNFSGGTTITGGAINYVRLCALKGALSLELQGLSRRGVSAYSIVKREFGFRGNKQRVYDQLVTMIDRYRSDPDSVPGPVKG